MSEDLSNFYAVILAGGGGTRLWPKSRKAHPKHLLDLFGDKTLIQNTLERIDGMVPNENIYVITHKDHVNEVKKQLPGLKPENIIAEPIAKNTAMAMGTASALIHAKNPDASIVFLAADHVVKNEERFRQNGLASLKVASSGDYIVAIGIKPDFPHTGLGYIKVGEELGNLSKVGEKGFVFKVLEFKEKPNLVTAQSFVASGGYLWNANLYSWSTKTILKAFEKYSPGLFKAVSEIADKATKDNLEDLLDKVYSKVDSPTSIDYEISEKADNIVVIPADFGWSDVGDWKVVYDLRQKNVSGVALSDETELININSKNILVDAGKKLVAVVGVDNLVIVDTGDALLISKADETQDVKKVVEKLKEEKKEEYL